MTSQTVIANSNYEIELYAEAIKISFRRFVTIIYSTRRSPTCVNIEFCVLFINDKFNWDRLRLKTMSPFQTIFLYL